MSLKAARSLHFDTLESRKLLATVHHAAAAIKLDGTLMNSVYPAIGTNTLTPRGGSMSFVGQAGALGQATATLEFGSLVHRNAFATFKIIVANGQGSVTLAARGTSGSTDHVVGGLDSALGTFRVVSSTGAYAHTTGSGRFIDTYYGESNPATMTLTTLTLHSTGR